MARPLDHLAPGATPRATRSRSAGRALAVLLALAMLAGACGDSADEGSQGSPDSAAPDSGSGAGTDGDGAGAAGTDTIRIGVASLQEQFADPHLVVGGLLFPLLWAIGEGLYRQDLDAQWVPALATGYELSEDELEWTFTLREGVKMHDGSTFTANDVKTAADRVLGSDDFAHYSAFRQFVERVEVIDDLTVKVVTNQPFATLLGDMPVPIPTDYYKRVGEEGFRQAPMAAGPFKFVGQELNTSVSYERFDEFWDEERRPNFRELVYEIIPDESSRIAGLRTGSIDIAAGLTPLAAQQFQGQQNVRILESEATAQADVFVVANRHPDEPSPLLDVDVRRALLMAVDRQAIADSLYRGYADVANGGLSPITLGFDEDREAVPYDPDGARELLEQAGAWPLSVTLNSYSATASLPDINKLTEAIAGYWQQLGIDVTLNISEANAYLPEYRARNVRDTGILSSPAQYFTEPGRYNVYYTTDGAYSTLTDPAVDAVFQELAATVDIDEREELGRQLGDLLAENLWALPMVRVSTLHAIGPGVESWDLMRGNPYAGPAAHITAS